MIQLTKELIKSNYSKLKQFVESSRKVSGVKEIKPDIEMDAAAPINYQFREKRNEKEMIKSNKVSVFEIK